MCNASTKQEGISQITLSTCHQLPVRRFQNLPINIYLLVTVSLSFCNLYSVVENYWDLYTSRKMDINTGSRGPFVPKIKPVQKIRDKSPPPLVPVPYKPVLKGPPRWLPGECRARDLWYRFVTQTGTKGWLQCRGREFRV
jgi:hypothetical protein